MIIESTAVALIVTEIEANESSRSIFERDAGVGRAE